MSISDVGEVFLLLFSPITTVNVHNSLHSSVGGVHIGWKFQHERERERESVIIMG